MSNYDILVKVGADTTALSSELGKAQKAISNTTGNLTQIGNRLSTVGKTMAIGFGAVSTGLIAGLGASVKAGLTFENQMARVNAISGASASEFKKLRDQAIDLGAKTTKSATDIAMAQETMAAAGLNTNQILAATPGVISAVEASGEDMVMVTEAITSALNGFGLKATESAHVADVMAQAANDSNASVNDLAYAFKYAAPVARSLGVSLEETAAATEIMTNAGMKGEQAGTTLRTALTRLVKPPKQAADMLNALGVQITDSSGKMRPFGSIVDDIGNKTKNMGNAQRGAAFAAIFGQEAMTGMLSIANAGPGKLDKLANSLRNSDGAAKEMASKSMSVLGRAIENMQGAFESLAILVSEIIAPALAKLATWIGNVVDKLNSMSPTARKMVVWGAVITAAISGVLAIFGAMLAMFAPLIVAIAEAGGVVAFLTPFVNALGAAFGFLVNPVVLVIAAITAIGAGLVLAYKKVAWFRSAVNSAIAPIIETFKTFAKSVSNIFARFKNQFKILADLFSGLMPSAGGDFKSMFIDVVTKGLEVLGKAFNFIFKIISTVIVNILVIINTVLAKIIQFIWKHGDELKAVFSGVWQIISSIIKGALGVIMGIFKIFSGIFSGDWNEVWSGIKQIFSSIWTALVGAFKGYTQALFNIAIIIFTSIRDFLSGIWDSVVEKATNIWGAVTAVWATAVTGLYNIWRPISDFFSALWNTITTAASSAWTTFTTVIMTILSPFISIFMTMWNGISTGLSMIWEGIKNVAQGAWVLIKNVILAPILVLVDLITGDFSGVKNDLTQIWSNIKNAANQIWTGIKQVIAGMVIAGVSYIRGIWDGFKQYITSLWNAIKSTASNIWSWIKATVINLVSGLVVRVISFWNSLKTSTSNIWNSIKSFASSTWNNIKSTVINLVNGIKQGAINAWNNLKSATSSAFKAVVNFIKNPLQGIDLFEIGKNIIQGLINGIGNMAKAVQKKVEDIAGGIKKKIKGALGIHSPSRVMRDEVGKWIPAGIGVGITNNASSALNAAMQMSQTISDAVKRNVDVGRDVGQNVATNLANGISNKISSVKQAVNNMLNAASSNLENVSKPFSGGLNSQVSESISATVEAKEDGWKNVANHLARLGDRIDGMQVSIDGKNAGRIIAPHVSEAEAKSQRYQFKARGSQY